MSNHHRLTRRETESILDAPVEPASRLSGLLGALRAPARPAELRREDLAVAAFHTARLEPVTSTRSVMTTPRRAATRAVVATGIVVTLASGGFALAATDNLPTLPGQASDQATASVAKVQAAASESETVDPTETTQPADNASATESASPTPSFKGLCKAYQNGNRQTRGKSLDSAAFTALATEAGGKESIATYCVTVIGEPKAKPSKPAKPTQAATPSKPAKPTKPTRAVTATKPTPLKPTRPTRPEPVKPTQATTPVKPTATPTTATTSAQDAKDTKDAKGKPAGAGRP